MYIKQYVSLLYYLIYLTQLLVFLIVKPAFCEVTLDEIETKWKSPYVDPIASKVFIGGSALTLFLVANKKGLIDPVQKDASEDKPLGEWANFGDVMGMSVPNALYLGGMYGHYKYTGNSLSYHRAIYMFEASAYAGMTTVVLKRLFGQRRPNKGDNLSFPSGHTTTATAFATVVAMEHELYWGLPASLIAATVGYSRINDNAHYLHDVVFGATLGISYGIALQKFHTKEKSNISVIPVYVDNENFRIAMNFTW